MKQMPAAFRDILLLLRSPVLHSVIYKVLHICMLTNADVC
jgi:hypothetical protein